MTSPPKNDYTGEEDDTRYESKFCRGSLYDPVCGEVPIGELESPDLSGALKHASALLRKSTVAHSATLIDNQLLQNIVLKNKKRMEGFCIILFCAAYFAVYAFSSVLHLDVTEVYLIEKPLHEALNPSLDEVLEVNDVWNWLQDTFVPIFFRQTDVSGEPLPRDQWSHVFQYSVVQGSVVLEQWRGAASECKPFQVYAPVECHPYKPHSNDRFGLPFSSLPDNYNWSAIVDNEDEGFVITEDPGRRLRNTREEIKSGNYLGKKGQNSEAFTFFLHPNVEVANLKKRIEYLRLREWLDKSTSVFMVKAIILNGESATPRIDNVQVTFQFSRGGGIFTSLRFHPLPLKPVESGSTLVFDVLFIMCSIFDQAWTIIGSCLALRRRRLKSHFLISNNIFGMFNIFLSWIVIMGFLMQVYLTSGVTAKLDELGAVETNKEREQVAMEMDEVVSNTGFIVSWYYLLITYYSIFLMFRLFVALEFQPRLALVINTLKATAADLFHFLIIFIPTFVAYAIAGMCIFGRRVDQFSSLTRSIGTCYKIAIENEFDWQTLSQEHFGTAASWVWTYLILICLIMLNMVLAIIMDVYTEMRVGSNSDETVFDSIRHGVSWLNMRIHGQRFVSDDEILEVLSHLPVVITARELILAFPNMHEVQRNRLIKAARERALADMRVETQTSSNNDLIAGIKLGLDKVSYVLRRTKAQHIGNMRGAKRSDSTCVEDIMQSMAVQNHWTTFAQTQLNSLRDNINGFENHKSPQ